MRHVVLDLKRRAIVLFKISIASISAAKVPLGMCIPHVIFTIFDRGCLPAFSRLHRLPFGIGIAILLAGC